MAKRKDGFFFIICEQSDQSQVGILAVPLLIQFSVNTREQHNVAARVFVAPAAHTGVMNEFWLPHWEWPSSVLSVIWRVNQRMLDLYLCLSLPLPLHFCLPNK